MQLHGCRQGVFTMSQREDRIAAFIRSAAEVVCGSESSPSAIVLNLEGIYQATNISYIVKSTIVAQTDLVNRLFYFISDEGRQSYPDAAIRQSGLTILWSVCIAHMANKAALGEKYDAVPKLLDFIRQSGDEDMESRRVALTLLWSICYGIEANQRRVGEVDGIPLVLESLPQCPNAAAGALWHISSYSANCLALRDLGSIPKLIQVREIVEQLGDEGRVDTVLCAMLAICNILQYCDIDEESSRQALDGIASFVRSQNPQSFQPQLVWTTLRPVIDLLGSARPVEVQMLGALMTVSLTRSTQYRSRFFTEGVTELIQALAMSSDATLRNMAISSCMNLGIRVGEAPAAMKLTDRYWDDSGLEKWLESLGLGQYLEAFQKAKIDMFSLFELTDEDLEGLGLALGPRRKIARVVKSMRVAQEGYDFGAHQDIYNALRHGESAPSQQSAGGLEQQRQKVDKSQGQDANDEGDALCLLCFDREKDACFYPCGHVAVCVTCAQALRSRGDDCPICRTAIVDHVRPFYV